jgi:ornithine decarboxylase
VFCRILFDCVGGVCRPLFGCEPAMATDVLSTPTGWARAYGVSFHVGSQQRNPHAWDRALASAAAVFRNAASAAWRSRWSTWAADQVPENVPTRNLRLGDLRALRRHFGNAIPETIIGRAAAWSAMPA